MEHVYIPTSRPNKVGPIHQHFENSGRLLRETKNDFSRIFEPVGAKQK